MNSLTYESVSGRKGGLVSIACASSRSEILAYRPDGICKLCLTFELSTTHLSRSLAKYISDI